MHRRLLVSMAATFALVVLSLMTPRTAHAQLPYCTCASVPIEVDPSLACTIEIRIRYPDGTTVGQVLLPGAKISAPCVAGMIFELHIGGDCWVSLNDKCNAVHGVAGSPRNCCVTACFHENMAGCWMVDIRAARVLECTMCQPGGGDH